MSVTSSSASGSSMTCQMGISSLVEAFAKFHLNWREFDRLRPLRLKIPHQPHLPHQEPVGVLHHYPEDQQDQILGKTPFEQDPGDHQGIYVFLRLTDTIVSEPPCNCFCDRVL